MSKTHKFTDALVRTLPAGTYTDAGAGLKGASLTLSISPKGKRTFDLLYRDANGKRCRLGSKRFRDCDRVAAARKTATDAWKALCAGHDPAGERRADRETGSVHDIAEDYCASVLASGENSPQTTKYVTALRNSLKDDPLAVLPARKVTLKDVDAFLKRRQKAALKVPQATDGKASVEYARRQLVAAFNHASIVPNPATAPKERHNTKAKRIARARAKGGQKMPLAELARRCGILWQETKNEYISQDGRDMLLLLIMLGNRKSEIRFMRWAQIDWERKLWLVPSELIGNKSAEEDEVPLTKAVLSVLKRRHAEADDAADLVFPSSRNTEAAYAPSYMNRIVTYNGHKSVYHQAICERHGFYMKVHHLRRLMASWCEVHPRHKWAVPHVLNHAAKHGDGVDRLYTVAEDIEPLRETMQAFENWVIEQAEGQPANVVKLGAA